MRKGEKTGKKVKKKTKMEKKKRTKEKVQYFFPVFLFFLLFAFSPPFLPLLFFLCFSLIFVFPTFLFSSFFHPSVNHNRKNRATWPKQRAYTRKHQTYGLDVSVCPQHRAVLVLTVLSRKCVSCMCFLHRSCDENKGNHL